MVGRKIDRFVLLDKLGQGGMATVWKARDELLGRTVAIKLLNEAIASTPDARNRFRHEGEIAALLEHPGITPVYDAGECGDSAYLVMALVDGETLAQRMERSLMPIAEAVRVVAAAAEAIGYAHGRGVIHRDLTPRNIMLGRDGRVFVLDFGIALAYGSSRVTPSGALLGTAAYIAPEVLLGADADPRSDVYSLGVVLYEVLTGALPHPGRRDAEHVFATLNLPIGPPSSLRPEIDQPLDRVVLRSLARDPRERIANGDELEAELEARAATPTEAAGASSAGTSGDGDRGTRPTSPSASVEVSDPPGVIGRFTTGSAPVFVALLPFEASDEDEEHARLLGDLGATAAASLARLRSVHVVPVTDAEPGAGPPALRALARRVGANLVVRGLARFAGTRVRLTVSVLDPERGAHVGGGVVDGSTLLPFDLEDHLTRCLEETLALELTAHGLTGDMPRSAGRDPASRERLAQALAYLRRHDNEASLEGSITLLESLIASEGESAVVQAALARACLYRYRLNRVRAWESRAAAACERARALDPHSPEVMLALGELHVAAGRPTEALVELDRALEVHADLYEAHLARARALDSLGRTEEAERACQHAIARRPGDWRAYHELGLVLFRHGRYPQAVGPWRRVTRLVPDNASAHRNLGSTYFHMDRYEQAIEAFQRSIEIRPNTMALYNLGTVLFFLGRHDESLTAFERAVALSPSDGTAWSNLGSACRFIPGHEDRMRAALERAVPLLRERLERNPSDVDAWTRLGGCLANLGCGEEALDAVHRALELAPDDVHVMVGAGGVFLRNGERERALEWYGRALQRGYGRDALRRDPELSPYLEEPDFRRLFGSANAAQHEAAGHPTPGGRP